MQYDLNVNIKNRDGTDMLENNDVVSVATLIVRAIDAIIPTDKDQTVGTIKQNNTVAKIIQKAADEKTKSELTIEQVSMVQKRVCIYNTLVSGQIIDLLESN